MSVTYCSGSKNPVTDGLSHSHTMQPDKPPVQELMKQLLPAPKPTTAPTPATIDAQQPLVPKHTDEPDDDIKDLINALDKLNLCTLTVPTTDKDTLQIQLPHDDAIMPCKAHPEDAGFNVFCPKKIMLKPKACLTILLGIVVLYKMWV
ncbi:hypothetical protein LPJ66_002942 [Kickxella alabastrina]|uniref:Uncharacterized protein n=1 Tax=Kickxella alabastrina TaxID=61397 RepID=A0ACC1IMH0_9FUNG|nr:hypothetical protein LPJ66_002942 [Kickxella alabastrina]